MYHSGSVDGKLFVYSLNTFICKHIILNKELIYYYTFRWEFDKEKIDLMSWKLIRLFAL